MAVIDRNKIDPEEVKAAEGMETLFLNYVMKVMRESVPKTDMDLNNSAVDVYQSMRDQQFAQEAARHGGIGLADQIIAYYESQRYNPERGVQAPSPNHGKDSEPETPKRGAHEGPLYRR